MPISGGKHGFQAAPYYHTVTVPNATFYAPAARVVIQNAMWTGVPIVAINQLLFATGIIGNLQDIFTDQITDPALAQKGPFHCEGTDNRFMNTSGVGRDLHLWGLQYA